jgi:hypothetical protein
MLETYVNQLIIDLAIEEDISTDIEECYRIQLDEKIEVTVKALQPGCFFSAAIAPLPEGHGEDLLTHMMSGNLLGMGTGETVLGLNEQGKIATLSQSVTYETTYQEFRDYLEDFVNYVDFWQTEISKYA